LKLDWLAPRWPAPANVRSVCTTRAGGVSKAPFDSLNLGDHVGDVAASVVENRAVLQRAISAKPVFLKQVHGVQVVSLNAETLHGTEADACITAQSGVACTIMVADCLPVLFTNRAGSFVAAAHAGWRGLAGESGIGVLEATFESIQATKTLTSDTMAWLGPCIGATQFEVGGEVRDAFASSNLTALRHFTPSSGGKWLADLRGLARQRLKAMGITQIYGNDGSAAWCTASEPSRFFSHRRDSVALGGSGRMAACIWLA
jgi:polyphenol oxidase